MKAWGIIRAILALLKELFGYGKKVENEKLEAMVDDRRRDKLDWVDARMSNGSPPETGRDPDDHSEQ
jgi:hypothetical protein